MVDKKKTNNFITKFARTDTLQVSSTQQMPCAAANITRRQYEVRQFFGFSRGQHYHF